MNTLFLADAEGALAAFGIFGLVGGFILAALYALCPLIIMWQLGGVKQRIDRQRTEELKALKGATDEIRTQNALTRQLLRAYGHEPEA
jgi:hypothetical protein